MKDPEVAQLQIAVVSDPVDGPRLEEFISALRGTGLRVWWDGDSANLGEDWKATLAVLQTAKAVCVAVSRSSIGSPRVVEALRRPHTLKRDPSALVLDRGLGTSRLQSLTLVPRIELHSEASRLNAVASVQNWVRSIDRGTESRWRSAALAGSGHDPQRAELDAADQAQTGIRPPAIFQTSDGGLELLLGDAAHAAAWRFSSELEALLRSAARLAPSSESNRFPVSFTRLLSALFYGGAWQQWCQAIAQTSGLDMSRLVPMTVENATVEGPLRASISAARVLEAAHGYAQRSNTVVDVHHVLAAFCFDPAGHERQLENYRFDRVFWANALVDEVARRFPLEERVFRALRDEAFPVSQRVDGTSSPAQRASPSSAELLQASADDRVRLALSIAAVLARLHPDGPGPIGALELTYGLLRTDGDGELLARMLADSAKSLGTESSSDSPIERIRRSLAVPSMSVPAQFDRPSALAAELDSMADALNPGETPFSVAFVFLALWHPGQPGSLAPIDPLLTQLGVDSEPFLERLATHFESERRTEAMRARELIRLRRPPYRVWNRPHIDNDRVGGAIPPDKDLLDARKPALRFAKLLAAKQVAPPIALGLFGNWGSGKTFFMGLMRDRIDDLAANGGDDYVRGVAQIEFNAWHYHDTNLWASLAMRIFEGLAEKLGGKRDSDVERKRKELHQKISSSAARRSEAAEIRTKALKRRAAATTKLDELRAERDALRANSAQLQRKAAWAVVTSGASYEALRKTVLVLAQNFGISEAHASVEQVRKLQRDVEDTRAHALGVLTAVGRRFHGVKDSFVTLAVLSTLILGALALGWGVESLNRLEQLELPRLTATLVQLSALVTAIAAWCGRRVRELRGALDTIGAVEADLARAEEGVEPDAAMKKLEDDISTLDQEIHKQSEEVSAAEREIAEATAEIDRINRGGLVYDFLTDRRSAATYVGQLGLISTIRQDFERLGELLVDFAKNAEGATPIERIVLYIDDLDRCHPDKVVEVLQAVHLLLAFPLFNVVVGVDARWLERSLRRQYVGRGAGSHSNADDPFSPQDYLEKIFQIPYALSRMDQNGFTSLIGGMIETRSEWNAKETKRRADEASVTEREQPATPEARTKKSEGDHSARAKVADEVEATKKGANESAEVQDDRSKVKDTAIVALYFEDHEQRFIATLYNFIDRPRLAKRFINIYRLLRVRADDEGESEFAASANSEGYRAALTLLAILVGHPNVASKIVEALERSGSNGIWMELLDNLADARPGLVACSAREREEVREVAAKLREANVPAPEAIHIYRIWAQRVMRYSFDWHRPRAFAARGVR
jgi:hypothetical protein